MLGLMVENIEIVARTNGEDFSANIPLSYGLNVIRAENSSGKSTCVNAIAYGLGLEAILGPSRKRPFPRSLYEVILDSKEDENPFFVTSSYVTLTIKNSKGTTAIVTRDILGDHQKVVVDDENGKSDYFLGVSGTVGSAKSDKGFHHWFTKFIGWTLPKVVTYEAKETLLYLECIFPLFFIEQKRGWSEIQANIPTQYGIRNVKKAALEFCLGIDSFEHEQKIAQYQKKVEAAEDEWAKLCASAEGIADFNSVSMTPIPPVNEYKDTFDINFMYHEGATKISVTEKENSLSKYIDSIAGNVAATKPDTEKLDTQLAILRRLRRESEEKSKSKEIIMLALSEADEKLSALHHDLDQYQQLRRLKAVGSDIDADLGTEKCPICESDLYDTLGNRSVKREPMTLEENIVFLKNQIDFYKNIRIRNVDSLDDLQAKGKLITSRIEREEFILSELREDIEDVHGDTKALLREKIQAELALRDVVKLRNILNDLKTQAQRVRAEWSSANGSLKELRKASFDIDRSAVVRELEAIVKGNLTAFKFTPAAIDSVSISTQSLRPEQEGYDIVAESSASDYIRIIWSYTLALLQLAAKKQNVLHGGFIVFDEPRQHEASKLSFTNLISRASESTSFHGQVIFATSLEEDVLVEACSDKDVNLICFDDYILQPKLESDSGESEAANDNPDSENP